MTTNQSDFERERQRILAEIEAKARKKGGELTLQDWLKAAEEVMPDEDRKLKPNIGDDYIQNSKQERPNPSEEDVVVSLSSATPMRSAKSSLNSNQEGNGTMEPSQPQAQKKNLVFLSIVFGTLVILVLALGGFAYLHVQNQVSELNQTLSQLQQQLGEINIKLKTLESQQASSGKGAAFDALVDRLAKLEKRMDENPAAQPALPMEQVSDQIKSELSESNVITEAVLDAKLEQFSKRIEQAIDKRFTTILAQLKHLNAIKTSPAVFQSEQPKPADQEAVEIPKPDLPKTPKAPVVTSPAKTQPATQPLSKSENAMNADEQWLASLPDNAYILQLASVLDRKSLERLKQQKGLLDARIIRQNRSGQVFYVLVTGNFADRSEAQQAAQRIRQQTGINPWIRPAKALKKNLPQ